MTNDMEVLKALPVLQKIWNFPTLSDYFDHTIAPLKQTENTIEKKMIVDIIAEEAERLYGKDESKCFNFKRIDETYGTEIPYRCLWQ